MSLLAQRYAQAIFAVAKQQDAADAVAADLSRLGGVLADPDIRAAVTSPDTTAVVRRQIVDKLLGDAHQLTRNLVGVVLHRRREAVLADLAGAYGELLRESRGEVAGVVESAKPLDAEGLKAVEAHAAKLTGKKVSLQMVHAPELIGGVRLKLGNTLYDGSVATVLEDLERSLMEAPI